MPLLYTVPQTDIPPPKVIDPSDLNGEDVSLRGGDLAVSSGGDWAIVQGGLAARQSVEREAVSSPGDMPRRPEWGMGLRDSLMRGSSVQVRDRQSASVRRRLNANPRISKVNVVDVVQRTDLAPGTVTITISADVSGQKVSFSSDITPKKGR